MFEMTQNERGLVAACHGCPTWPALTPEEQQITIDTILQAVGPDLIKNALARVRDIRKAEQMAGKTVDPVLERLNYICFYSEELRAVYLRTVTPVEPIYAREAGESLH